MFKSLVSPLIEETKVAARQIASIEDCQITHLICVPLTHLLYDFIFLGGGVLGFLTKKTTGRRPKTPPKKSYRKC